MGSGGFSCQRIESNFKFLLAKPFLFAVQSAFLSRPVPDEALCAVLWEYKDRGKKGYDMTEKFFAIFRSAVLRQGFIVRRGFSLAGASIPGAGKGGFHRHRAAWF